MSLTDQLKSECASKGLNYVGFRGNPYAPICVAGEAPGADEDEAGLPFVGASGKEQDRMLREAGIQPDQVCFTNPYKVRPPNNDLTLLPSLGIPLDLFERQFIEEVNTYKPTIIICAGATSMRLLCPQTGIRKHNKTDYPIGKWRGSLLTSPFLTYPHYVIPVQHPAFILREWSERQVSVMLYERALEEWTYVHKNGQLNPLPQRTLITNPPYAELFAELKRISDTRQRVSVDIELLWLRPVKKFNIPSKRLVYTIALATSPSWAVSFCFWDYSVNQLQYLFPLLQRILTNNKQIGQNYITFDCSWLSTIGLKPDVNLVDDVMVKHHVLYIEMPHNLAFMTMQFTRENYYKDEARAFYAGGDKNVLLRYNAKDSCLAYEIETWLEEEMK